MKLISFVIPVYRNQGSLKLTYDKILAVWKDRLTAYGYEFIFVDDGSDDESLAELLKLREHDECVKIISFSRNFGQVAAVIAGFRVALGDCVVNMSADLQDPAEKITEMIAEYEKGNDVVICHRIEREDGFAVSAASKLFYTLMSRYYRDMPTGGFDFVALSRRAVVALNRLDERNRFFQGDLLWLGFHVKFIPYKREKRTVGKSQWTFAKKLKYLIDGFLNTSYIPIRFISLIGVLTSLLGFIYAVVIVIGRFFNQTPFPGWAPIMILLLMIGGLIMIMLGIIGEYVWRIYDETRHRPVYIVKHKYGLPVQENE